MKYRWRLNSQVASYDREESMTDFNLTLYADSPSAMESEFDTTLAPLLANTFLWMSVETGDQVRVSEKELMISMHYDDAGAVISNPYKLRVFEGATLAEANTALSSFLAANSTYFFGPTFVGYLDKSRNTEPFLLYLVYNEDLTDGEMNWNFGGTGGGGGGGGGIVTTGITTPTVVDSLAPVSIDSVLWRVTGVRTDIANQRVTELLEVTHDGTTSYDDAFGGAIVPAAAGLLSFSVAISGGNIELTATPSAGTWTVTVQRLAVVP